ncbi:MAG: alpha/beta fold hydrolase [Acidimicrobiales bacterium]
MPHAVAADGTRLYYEVVGPAAAPPLLMIQGLGADSRGWIRQRRALSSRYRCVLFDNRGVGRSDKPAGPYDLEVMASDAVAVLDDAGVATAHVLGASMGGVLAQMLGVRHQHRVRSLALACTACRHHRWRRELLAEWAELAERDGMGPFILQGARWLVGPRSLRRLWPALGLLGPVGPLALSTPPEAFVAQIEAILDLGDDIRFELRDVAVPTLVLVGSQDILTPLGDSEEIASLVPGAELAVIGGAAHGFMFEHASSFNRTVLDFLDRTVAAGLDDAATARLDQS